MWMIEKQTEWFDECLETAGWKGIGLVGVIINLLLYANYIILLAKSHDDLDEQLKTLHVYCSKMGMAVNTDKTKVMII